MKSPTTILNSIQMMKSNLKNDKQQLRIIKNNFSSLQRSVSLSDVNVPKYNKSLSKGQTIVCGQQILKQIQTQDNILSGKDSLNKKNLNQRLNKQNINGQDLVKQKMCLINIKKKHQRQVKQIKQKYKEQIQNLIKQQKQEIDCKQSQIRKKQQELTKYISILQGQLNQAEKQIQQLKQKNYQQVQSLKVQNNQLRQKIKTLQDKTNKIQKENPLKYQIYQQNRIYDQSRIDSQNNIYQQNESESQTQKISCQCFQKQEQNNLHFVSKSICNSEQISFDKKSKCVQECNQKNQYKGSQILPEFYQKCFQQNQQNIGYQKFNDIFQILIQSQRSKHCECCNNIRIKYQKIINKLLQQNSALLFKIQKNNHDNLQKQSQIKVTGILPKVTGILPKVTGILPKVNGILPKVTDILPKVTDILPSSKIQKSKSITSQSNYNSQVTERNQIFQSRGKKSIVYKISNVLASSNVSSIQSSKVRYKKNKDKKYFKTQANQNYQNDQNINLSNIRKTSQQKNRNISPVEDFYSRIEIEQTLNFEKKQVNEFNGEFNENIKKLNESDYQILEDQFKVRTIKRFMNLNQQQNSMDYNNVFLPKTFNQNTEDGNFLFQKPVNSRKKYINVKL